VRENGEEIQVTYPIPPLDAQIAAVARVHGLVVLTADHHFENLDRVSRENWLS
jgi:predicted nucleic acid-binding protein